MNPPEYSDIEFMKYLGLTRHNDESKISFHFITNRNYANRAISRILEDVDRSLIETKISVKSSDHSVEVETLIIIGAGLIGVNATKKFTNLLMTDLYEILKNRIFPK